MDMKVALSMLVLASAGVAHGKDSAVCSSLPVHATILNGLPGHTLAIIVENPSSRTVELEAFDFAENMLRFSGVEKSNGQPLKVVIPLLSPGVEPLKIKPHEKFVREVRLDVIFPGLPVILQRTAVEISWKVTLKPHNGCFAEEITTTMRLPERS